MIQVFTVVLFVYFLFPVMAHAQVVLNEIAWMGTPVPSVDARQWWRYEWAELHNISDTDISVSGWSLELYRDNLDYSIPLYGSIQPHGYFVVAASSQINETDVNYATLAGKFVNAGQKLVLRDKTGNSIDQVDARAGWFAGDNEGKLSMERRFPGRNSDNAENWGSSLRTGGTPGAQNSIFQKEAVLHLDEQHFSAIAKQSPKGLSFLPFALHKVFILAVLLAGAFALLILMLWRHLRSQGEGSSDAL